MVGQGLAALDLPGCWIKVMTYGHTYGPAGLAPEALRLELEQTRPQDILRWREEKEWRLDLIDEQEQITIIATVGGTRIRPRRKTPGPKPLPEGVKKRRVNICLSPHWRKVGKERAAARMSSFSETLEELVYRDSLHNESGQLTVGRPY